MMTLWKSVVCLFRRSECESGFRGDETTDFFSETKRRAREQELATLREVDRIVSQQKTGNPLGDLLADRSKR